MAPWSWFPGRARNTLLFLQRRSRVQSFLSSSAPLSRALQICPVAISAKACQLFLCKRPVLIFRVRIFYGAKLVPWRGRL